MKKFLPFLFTVVFVTNYFHLRAQNDTIAKLAGAPIDTTGWTFVDYAQLNSNQRNTSVLLAPTDNGSGAVYYNSPVNFSGCKKWNIEFDFSIYGRLAEGMTFCFLKSPFQNLVGENGLGIPTDADGLRVCFDISSQCNPFDGNGPKIEVRWKPKGAMIECYDDQPTVINQFHNLDFLYSSTYNHARITYEDGHIRIYINNKLYLQCYHELNFTGYMGFTASSISYPFYDQLKNVFIYTQPSPNIERIVGQKFGLCGGGNFPFKAYSIERSAFSYTWSVPPGTNIISGAGTDSITLNVPANFTEGILSVTANSATCGAGNTAKEKISVRPNHPEAIYGPDHVVAGQKNITFSVHDTANVTYTWIVPDDITIVSGQGTDSIVVNWGQTSREIRLKIYQCNDSVQLKKYVHLQDCNITINGGNCIGDTLTANYNSTSALVKLAWKNLNDMSILRRDSFQTISIVPINPNQMSQITHVFVDAHNNLYLSSPYNFYIAKLLPNSTSVTCAAGCGGANAFNSPAGIFVDKNENVFVADKNNNRIQEWITGVSTSDTTVAGGNGQGSAANQLDHPTGVFVDANNNVYVADYNNNRVQKWAPGATTGVTVAGGNGQGSAANQLDHPISVLVDAAGNVYVLDQNNSRLQKWASGAITGVTVAGNANGSPGNSPSELHYPYDMSMDTAGNIYISDNDNNRVQKWAPGATAGVTVAGGLGKRLNQLEFPLGISVDNDSSLYIVDGDKNDFRILKYTSSNETINLNFVPIESNKYTAVATFENGCYAQSDPVQIHDCGSLEKNQVNQKSNENELSVINKTNKFSVYPNPANSAITLSFIAEKPSKYYIQITDISGKKLQRIEGVSFAGKNSVHVNINNYANGIYLISITSSDGTKTLKFCKQ